MSSASLTHLEQRYQLPRGATASMLTLLDRLSHAAAPTAVHERHAALKIHIADSLAGLEVSAVRDAQLIADLGAGAGIPGLVLAAGLPASEVVLVESAGKKCGFIRATATAMRLDNVVVVHARAEQWTAGRGRFDVVCARALASLSVVCEYAAPLLREGGTLVAWKGAVEMSEAADGRAAAAQLGLSPAIVMPVVPYPGSSQRTLHVFRKIAPTPSRYPRRAGVARKRPLSATNPC